MRKGREETCFPVKLKIRIGNKTPKRKNEEKEIVEVEDNADFEINLEEEIIENEEDVISDDINVENDNEEEEDDEDNEIENSDDEINDSDDDEVVTSQANSECVNEENDDEDDDENEDEEDEDNNLDNDDDNEYSQNDEEVDGMSQGDEDNNDFNQKNRNINLTSFNKNILKPYTIKTFSNNYHNKNKTIKNNINKSINEGDGYEDDDWLNDDEDVDYKKYKSACALTVRQRALFHGEKVEDLMELSTSQRVVELSEEQVMKRRRKAMRRRQLAEEKDEKEKRSTLHKLLKKQDSKMKFLKNQARPKNRCNTQPPPTNLRITYNRLGTSISLPVGWEFPLSKTPPLIPKASIKCGIDGCMNRKRYNCSRTNLPLCSLQCYKQNMRVVSSS